MIRRISLLIALLIPCSTWAYPGEAVVNARRGEQMVRKVRFKTRDGQRAELKVYAKDTPSRHDPLFRVVLSSERKGKSRDMELKFEPTGRIGFSALKVDGRRSTREDGLAADAGKLFGVAQALLGSNHRGRKASAKWLFRLAESLTVDPHLGPVARTAQYAANKSVDGAPAIHLRQQNGSDPLVGFRWHDRANVNVHLDNGVVTSNVLRSDPNSKSLYGLQIDQPTLKAVASLAARAMSSESAARELVTTLSQAIDRIQQAKP